jgi:hypothetical protein
MAVLVNAVAFFTAVVLGTRIKLDILASHLLKASKRLFGIPDFRLYAIADGIREVCARAPRRPEPAANDPPQLKLQWAEISGECPDGRCLAHAVFGQRMTHRDLAESGLI